MRLFARGDFDRMTPLRRVHRVRDIRALRKTGRLCAEAAPRAAGQPRRERTEGQREPGAGREPAGGETRTLPPRPRPTHDDKSRLLRLRGLAACIASLAGFSGLLPIVGPLPCLRLQRIAVRHAA